MIMTNEQILKAFDCLSKLSNMLLNTTLKYRISRNICYLDPYKKSLDSARDGSNIPGAKDFLSKRQEIFNRHSSGGKLSEDGLKFLNVLVSEYDETIQAISEKEKEFLDLLKVEENIKEIKILPLDLFPEKIEIDIGPILPFIDETGE